MPITREAVLDALQHVVEPTRERSIVRLGMVRALAVEGERVRFTVFVDDPSGPFAETVADAARAAIEEHVEDNVEVEVEVESGMIGLGDDVAVSGTGAQPEPKRPKGVLNYVAVASGKGGVGKSTVAANLAVALARLGYDVGLVDADIYGPSVPTMFGLRDGKPRVGDDRRIIPLEAFGVKVLSMGFLVDQKRAVVWRGPMVTRAVRQFLGDTAWGDLDYLILDLPPGTGDIQLTIVQTIPLTGALIVSTPQDVALADARKGVAMFENVHVPVLGIVENMAYFAPPDLPDRKYYLFGRGGARRLAEELGVPFLGEVPIEQAVREGGDDGLPVVEGDPTSASAAAFRHVAHETARQVVLRNAERPPTQPVEILYK